MKRFKFLMVAALLVSALAVTFAFTSHNKTAPNKPLATQYFKFVGLTTSTADLEDPTQWVSETAAAGNHTNNFVSDLIISANNSTYIYSSGPNAGLPKVDISGALQNDVLLAGGHSTPSGVQEVSRTDYQIKTNSTRRS